MEQTITNERTTEDLAIKFDSPDLEVGANEEAHFEDWGDEQRMLVSLNQDVIVVCPWMDNAEVTLSTAMNTYEYPTNLTAEDEPFLISVVNELLASRVPEAEEVEDSVVEIEEELTETEGETELQEDEEVQPEDPTRRVVDDEVAKEKIGPPTTKDKKQSPAQHVTKIRQIEKPSADTRKAPQPKAVVETITSKPTATVTSEPTHSNRSATSKDESVTGQREVEVEQPPEVSKVAEVVAPEVAATPEQFPVTESIKPQIELDYEISDPPAQSLSVEIPVGPEPVIEDLEIDHLTALAEDVALSAGELVDVSEDQPVPASSPDHLDTGEPEEDDGEESIAIDRFTIPPPQVIENDASIKRQPDVEKDNDLERGANVEAAVTAPPAEVDVVVEQIMTEYVERIDLQTTEVANHYLDKIIEVAAEIGTFDEEDVTDETKTTEELEELFTELFDEMGVPYTPELIESLVQRTVEQRAAKNQGREDEEVVDGTRQSGLGAKLKKSSVGHTTLSDAIVHNRLISKIAFELCGFKASFSLN